MRARPFLFPVLILIAATVLTWRPWVGHGVDDVMLWAATTSLTHDGDTDVTNDLLHATNPPDLTRELLGATWSTGAKSNPYPVGFAVVWAPIETTAAALLTPGLDPAPRFHPRVRAVVSIFALVLALISLRLFLAVAARAGGHVWPAALAVGVLFLGSSTVMFTTRWPVMTHQLSALAVAAHLWTLLRWRDGHAPRWAAAAGLAAGLMILVRWQNVIYLVVAAALLLEALRARPPLARAALLFAAPLVVCVFLQPLVWKLTSGQWLLVPQGEAYLQNEDLAIGALLFSGYHGLFPNHPAFLVALIGLVIFTRRDPWLGVALLIAFVALVYVNQRVWDWWGAGAFGARRFCSFVAPAAIGLAEVLARVRRPAWRGLVVGALLLWSLIIIRLYDIHGDDLTLLVTGHPADTPRIGTPLVGVAELRADFVALFTDPFDGLLHPQLFRSLERHHWPAAPLFGAALLLVLAALAHALEGGLRAGGMLRRRWLVVAATLLGTAWVVFIEVRLILDDQSWRDHADTWHAAAHAAITEDFARAETLLRQIPPDADQRAAAQWLLAETLARTDQRDEAITILRDLVGDDTPHRHPPAAALLDATDHTAWLTWRRRTRDGAMD